MTISTRRIDRACRRANGRIVADARGFTLLEAMLSVTLGGLVLAAVLSTFLMIGRTSFNSSSYSQSEMETRRALETFGRAARLAQDIRWHSPQAVTLILPGVGGPPTMTTFAYDGEVGSKTYRCFYRVPGGDPAVEADRVVLVHDVVEVAFRRYKLEQAGVVDNAAKNNLETKQVQLKVRSARSRATTVAATQAGVSANFILRNKRVAN